MIEEETGGIGLKEKILVVDDEVEIADLTALYLRNEEFQVTVCYTGEDAKKAITQGPFDLAVLDVMLPGEDGFSLLQRIRQKYNYPVILLTAKVAETDKINGLSLGADDYVTKPFRPLELVARIKAQLRRYKRYNTSAPAQDLIELGGLVINTATHQCTLDERPLSLTPTEFSILAILCQNRGKVISAEELFHQLWKDEYYTKSNNSISVHIRHLREKMGDCFESPKYIKTVWGVGYRIEDSTISHP